MLASVVDSIRKFIPPIHREGYPFIMGALAIALFLFVIWTPLGWIGLILTLYVAFFFRDPKRATPIVPGIVVAPADGLITAADLAVPPVELGLGDVPLPRVSIFLSIFNVHVNRAPATGTISRIVYRPGKFLNADLDKASVDNERNGLVIDTAAHGRVGVVQIAGLIARRIVCWAEEGDDTFAGQRFGLIRFGSRLDVYMPAGTTVLVAVGQTAVAGETVLADIAGGVARVDFRVE
jgi:phosphatidylserine decarboxylase